MNFSFSEIALREALEQTDNMNTQHLEQLAAAVAQKIMRRKNEEYAAAVAKCLAIAASVNEPIENLIASRRPYTRRATAAA